MNMVCSLCKSQKFLTRKGKVRDAPDMTIVECDNCGLVALNTNRVKPGFYEKSGMHGAEIVPIDKWLKETERDDQRRFQMLKSMLPNKRLLDFGCGAGGFLKLAQELSGEVMGVEVENRVRDYWAGKLEIKASIEQLKGDFEIITAFHVIEHLQDPGEMLHTLAKFLARGGTLVVEVPNSEDSLLTLYNCNPFQNFTYWSLHLYLFNSDTLKQLAKKAGLRVVSIQHCQRYPLSNHLYWLSHGNPGGHQHWAFMDSPELTTAYSNVLAAHGKTDTLIAYLERGD
jgi:2-polyprenyl-3-methyl-5-hydroxy-6-metoxy-1,4-benzoquinol methylase